MIDRRASEYESFLVTNDSTQIRPGAFVDVDVLTGCDRPRKVGSHRVLLADDHVLLLDAFKSISRSLYDEYANRSDDHPREVLRGLIDRYFEKDVSILMASRVSDRRAAV